ncbi:hypothetical protein [Mesorhizobium sp. M0220]|uniref:hypothetical protein n=1 Tax=unclassified Mesorhizobium TaxID=325217 RepID=UPI00333B1E9E
MIKKSRRISRVNISVKVTIIPEDEATDKEKNDPSVAKIEIGGEDFIIVAGRADVKPAPKKK